MLEESWENVATDVRDVNQFLLKTSILVFEDKEL